MENKAEIIVDGDINPLRTKLRQAAMDLEKFGKDGSRSASSIGAAFEAVRGKFLAFTGLLAGGTALSGLVTGFSSGVEKTMALARAFDISIEAASKLQIGLEASEVNIDEFTGAAEKLARQIRTNESGLNSLGLKTRDASGNMRPLNELTVDAVDILKTYENSTQRAIKGQEFFGRGFSITTNLLKVNSSEMKAAGESAEKFGAVIGDDSVEAWKKYDDSMDEATIKLQGMKVMLGNELLPILGRFASWLSSDGADGVSVFSKSIQVLSALFFSLKAGATIVFEFIRQTIATTAGSIAMIVNAWNQVMAGNFSGALKSLSSIRGVFKEEAQKSLNEIVSASVEAKSKIDAVFGTDMKPIRLRPERKKDSGTGNGSPEEDTETEKKLKTSNQATEKSKALSEMEALYKRHNDLELDDEIKKVEAIIEANRKALKQQIELDILRLDSAKSVALEAMDEADRQADHEVSMNQMSFEKATEIKRSTIEARLAIEQEYIDRKKQISSLDPDNNPGEMEKLELEKIQVKARYAAMGSQLQREQALEGMRIWDSLSNTMGGLWDRGMQAMMNGTLTFRNAFRAIGLEMTRWFAVQVIGNMVKEWIAGHAKRLAALIGFKATEKTVEATASATTIGLKGTETAAVVANNALQAGTGAAASVAPTPFIGPMLALATMAAIFAAVSSFGSRKSARGGYDIPSGINPVTQLHEEEMVLPKNLANAVRAMAGGRQEGEGGINITMQIMTPNADSFRRSGDQIMGELRTNLQRHRGD